MNDLPFTAPEPRPIDGPRWVAGAVELNSEHLSTEQIDARGKLWWVEKIEQGGRVIHWRAVGGRLARTEAAPGHPQYPSDEAVLAWTRQRRREGRL